jgi:parallel beta-helix repeat protein
LNDRELKGPVTCPLGANGPACSATGLGVGIDASTAKNVSIFNGHVHGFGAQGIRAGRAGRIEDLDAFENGLAGIAANDLAELSHVRAEQNGGNGFTGGDGVSVSESHFNDNGKKGMQVQSDGTLIRIKSLRNLEEGIRATDNLSVTDGHVNGNKLRGVLVGVGAQLSGVIARNNVLDGFKVGDDALLDRLTATGNGGDGINAGNKSKIRNSLSSDNAENGVFAETASNIEDCIASHNKKGLVLSGGGGRVSGNTVKESVEKGMELSLTTLFQNNALADNPQHRTGGVNAGSNVCDTALCP